MCRVYDIVFDFVKMLFLKEQRHGGVDFVAKQDIRQSVAVFQEALHQNRVKFRSGVSFAKKTDLSPNDPENEALRVCVVTAQRHDRRQ